MRKWKFRKVKEIFQDFFASGWWRKSYFLKHSAELHEFFAIGITKTKTLFWLC
jgi:hypothetical protein